MDKSKATHKKEKYIIRVSRENKKIFLKFRDVSSDTP